MLFHVFHVLRLREIRANRVLILGLDENHRPAVRDLRLGDEGSDSGHVELSGGQIALVVCSQRCRISYLPTRKSSTGDFRVDIRSRTGEKVDPGLLCSGEERLEVEDAIITDDALLAFQKSPVYVEGDAIVSHGADFFEDIAPESRDGQAKGVEFSGEEDDALVAHKE